MSSLEAPGASASAWAVFTPAAAITSLANALDPSMRAASLSGPKTLIPFSRNASATPATRGISGPITTRSTSNEVASCVISAGSVTVPLCRVARSAIPALPGTTWRSDTAGSCESPRSRACSRAPEPITRMRMAASLCDGPVGAREQIWWVTVGARGGVARLALSAQHGGVAWEFDARNVTRYQSNTKAI